MNFFLDTNTCIFILRGKYPSIVKKMEQVAPSEIKIPAIVQAELLYGVEKSGAKEKTLLIVERFLEPFEIVPFCHRSAEMFATIRENLEKRGQVIGPYDLLIAATTKAHRGVLVTHNMKEFSRVKGLEIEDWVKG